MVERGIVVAFDYRHSRVLAAGNVCRTEPDIVWIDDLATGKEVAVTPADAAPQAEFEESIADDEEAKQAWSEYRSKFARRAARYDRRVRS